jgi:hypothetical protein
MNVVVAVRFVFVFVFALTRIRILVGFSVGSFGLKNLLEIIGIDIGDEGISGVIAPPDQCIEGISPSICIKELISGDVSENSMSTRSVAFCPQVGSRRQEPLFEIFDPLLLPFEIFGAIELLPE